MKTPSQEHVRPAWVALMYQALGLEPGAGAREVCESADRVACSLAPNARRLWRWILILEGVAVLLPMLWLMVLRVGWSPAYTAFSVLACTMLIVGVSWWLRWRGMQHTWARARMLAEIARSADGTSWLPGRATVEAMASAPRLQAIAADLPQEAPQTALDLEQLKLMYDERRLQNQLKHYTKKRQEALRERKQLSKLVTRSLDGALFLAVAGVALVLSGKGVHLMRVSGSDYVLGLVGTALPLVAILMQSLSSYLELNRRTGRYAQQIDFLNAAAARLKEVTSMPEALRLIHEVENGLLGEVVEWFYQAEHAELFYHSKNVDEAATIQTAVEQTHIRWHARLLRGLMVSMGFIVSVILGRLMVVALAVVITSAWIAFRVPKDYVAGSELHVPDGRLLSHVDAEGWEPVPERAARGFILIAHGLHDGVRRKDDKSRWMSRLQTAIELNLNAEVPDICLVDWSEAAETPALMGHFLDDLSAIRSKGEEIGRLVGFKLAMAIQDKKLSLDQPMHFIGHSAGGFVVMGAARTLEKLDLKPKNLRLTILDTPAPDVSQTGDLWAVSQHFPLDYYITSEFAKLVPVAGWLPKFTRYDIKRPDKMDAYLTAHSYAYEWYMESIENNDERGFVRSPFKQGVVPSTQTTPKDGR